MAWLLLAFGLTSFLFTYNSYHPRYVPGELALGSFFAGWLTAELALHHVVWQALLTAGLVWAGALASWPGVVGLALCVISCAWLAMGWSRAQRSGHHIDAALDQALGDDDEELIAPLTDDGAPAWRQLLAPIPVTHPSVERVRDIVYFEEGRLRLRLDVHRRRDADHGPQVRRPALIFVHGGGWIIGSKDQQGLPILQHLAARGWVCFSINYRLSPRATYPDHVVDVKRAIAWVRTHAAEYGVDADFILVSGNSAGAHLAALAALSAHRADLQPGFVDADTSVAGCISFYGVYDFTDRHGHWPHQGLRDIVERYVIKARFTDARERFADASPISFIDAKAPPFLIIHGDRDTVVPVAEGRTFFAELSAVSAAPCAYLEIAGAQHAFEIFPSPRTLHVLRGVERFARHLYRQHVARRASARAFN
jgi:acetyl esterase/lipase